MNYIFRLCKKSNQSQPGFDERFEMLAGKNYIVNKISLSDNTNTVD